MEVFFLICDCKENMDKVGGKIGPKDKKLVIKIIKNFYKVFSCRDKLLHLGVLRAPFNQTNHVNKRSP